MGGITSEAHCGADKPARAAATGSLTCTTSYERTRYSSRSLFAL
jgi:hypothetical protein